MTVTPELEAMARAICDAMGLADSFYKHEAARAALLALTPSLTDFAQRLMPEVPSSIAAMSAVSWVNSIVGESK